MDRMQEIKNKLATIEGIAKLVIELRPVMEHPSASVYANTPVGKFSDPVMLNSDAIIASYNSLLMANEWRIKLIAKNSRIATESEGYNSIVNYPDRLVCKNSDNSEMEPAPRIPTHIEKVYWLREAIEGIITELTSEDTPKVNEYHISLMNDSPIWLFVYQHLCEAKMQLGFELTRTRHSAK